MFKYKYAKANVTIKELEDKITSLGGPYNIVYDCDKVGKDLSKIDVDFENTGFVDEFDMPGTENLEKFEMLGNFPVAWCACGGDWQLPLVFVLYIGKSGKLHGYIPKKGNAYDHKNKCAYEDNIDYVFNADKLRKDVKNKIKSLLSI